MAEKGWKSPGGPVRRALGAFAVIATVGVVTVYSAVNSDDEDKPPAAPTTSDDVSPQRDPDPGAPSDADEPISDSPAREYAGEVASDLAADYPEVEGANCSALDDTHLSCVVRVGPTPANPEPETLTFSVKVFADGAWQPEGP